MISVLIVCVISIFVLILTFKTQNTKRIPELHDLNTVSDRPCITSVATTRRKVKMTTTTATEATTAPVATSCETLSTTCLPTTEAVTESVEPVTGPYVEPATEPIEKVEEISEEIIEEQSNVNTELAYVKHFSRGTYYAYGGARTGGSGRSLIDCSYGEGNIKGSIASSYLYSTYGYEYNGRTTVYLEIEGYESMNGYYYLDDSDAGSSEVIDFFFYYGSNCLFQSQGVVQVDCYI